MDVYCTQLGMVAEFSYCISVNEGLPCRNTIGCWKERIDIYQFLKERFTQEELGKALGGLPKSRIEKIMEGLNTLKEHV